MEMNSLFILNELIIHAQPDETLKNVNAKFINCIHAILHHRIRCTVNNSLHDMVSQCTRAQVDSTNTARYRKNQTNTMILIVFSRRLSDR